jgi:hypothetical protein
LKTKTTQNKNNLRKEEIDNVGVDVYKIEPW